MEFSSDASAAKFDVASSQTARLARNANRNFLAVTRYLSFSSVDSKVEKSVSAPPQLIHFKST